ncbi:hypothetical protein Holit_02113 [Hollandina sp. SP2]
MSRGVLFWNLIFSLIIPDSISPIAMVTEAGSKDHILKLILLLNNTENTCLR